MDQYFRQYDISRSGTEKYSFLYFSDIENVTRVLSQHGMSHWHLTLERVGIYGFLHMIFLDPNLNVNLSGIKISFRIVSLSSGLRNERSS